MGWSHAEWRVATKNGHQRTKFKRDDQEEDEER